MRATRSADVVVVGGGLSGLVAARQLRQAGLDVLVVEAQETLGGRIRRVVSDTGRVFEAGAEMFGLHMANLVALAHELGAAPEPIHANGNFVRYSAGVRFVEATPMYDQPELAEAAFELIGQLEELAAAVATADPWNAPDAVALDAQTLRTWLDARGAHPEAIDMMRSEIDFTGGTFSEVSLLFVLWLMRSMGGWEQWAMGTTHRFIGGTSALIDALAADLGDRVRTGTPVQAISRHDTSVTVTTLSGELAADAVIVAIPPVLCERITFTPPLPIARGRLQSRYLEGHGTKFVAVYAEPWWRADGYAGIGVGLPPILVVVDSTGSEHNDGRLTGFVPITSEIARDYGDSLSDPESAKALFVDRLVAYFGGRAANPIEVQMFSWVGDPYTAGASVALPPGVLSSVGHALREPVGRIVWAGAETGEPQVDWMEGAVAAGRRAAGEALALITSSA